MNPLSLNRLEEALTWIGPGEGEPEQTIQAALRFLLKPEVTDEMIDYGSGWGFDLHNQLTQKSMKKTFKAMIAALTDGDAK